MQYDPSLQRPLQAEREPGEQLLWAARPNAVRAMLPWLLIWLFAIPWTVSSANSMKGEVALTWYSWPFEPFVYVRLAG